MNLFVVPSTISSEVAEGDRADWEEFLTCLIAFDNFTISSVVAPEESAFTLEFTAFSISLSSVNPTDFAALERESSWSTVAVVISLRIFVRIACIEVVRFVSDIL